MNFFLLFISSVLLLGVLFSRLSDRIGVPVLLGFMALGMVFGWCWPGSTDKHP